MEATAINNSNQDFSLFGTQDIKKTFRRWAKHLLWDVIPTLLILTIVSGGTLLAIRALDQAKTPQPAILVDNELSLFNQRPGTPVEPL